MRVVPQEAEIEPGADLVVDVEVVDHAKAPLADAEVALVVVDESALALSGYPFLYFFFFSSKEPQISLYIKCNWIFIDVMLHTSCQTPSSPSSPRTEFCWATL